MNKFIGNPIHIEVAIRDVENNIPSWNVLEDIQFIFYTNEYKQQLVFSLNSPDAALKIVRTTNNTLAFNLSKTQTSLLTEDLLMMKVVVDPVDNITERLTYKKIFTGITMINP